MFDGLIEGRMAGAIADCAVVSEIIEIRMRIGRPLVVLTVRERIVVSDFGMPYIVSRADLERVLNVASDFSVYSVNDEIVKGYIPCGYVRLGVAGEGVVEAGRLLTVKNINFIVIRVPHQIKNVADAIAARVVDGGLKNTLIISPPAAGKTTMLRELARLASRKYNTLIIDERYELAFCDKGVPQLDVGDADVVSGIQKGVAYENCIRSMNPDLIVTDELFKRTEVEAVADIVRSGVRVFASVHGESLEAVEQSAVFCDLVKCFDVFVVLAKQPRVGSIKEIIAV